MPLLLRSIASLPRLIYFSNKSLFHAPISIRNFHTVYARRQDGSGVLNVARSDNLTVQVLRSYQEECVKTSLEQLKLGKNRQVVSLPVGSGKTVVMANLVSKIPARSPKATKTLVLAHREELLEQAQRQISSINPTLKVVIDRGRLKPDIDSADVVVASVPTLGRVGSERLDRYDPEAFKAILIDEAHHAAARTYQLILQHFHANDQDSDMFVWGCSATVRRHDGIGLQGVFDHIVYHRDFLTMVEEGWLCNMKVTTVQTKVDLSSVGTRYNDFKESELSKAINTLDRNDIIIKSWEKYAASDDRKSTLVFAVDMEHTLSLCNAFRARNVEARFITSKSSPVERQEALQAFRNGECPVLVNCGILTEGTDIPRIDCILMARPTKSSTLFQQMFGRGMRLHSSKKDCLVIDFVDNFSRAGRAGLITIPTLLGLDVDTTLDDVDLLEVEKQALVIEQSKLMAKNLRLDDSENIEFGSERPTAHLTITEYDSVFEVMDDCSGSKDLYELSRNAWVAVGDQAYVLAVKSGSIKVEQEDGVWGAKLRKVLPNRFGKSIYTKPQELPITGDTRDQAIKAVDTYVKSYYKSNTPNSQWVLRNAKFRQEPATEAQIQVLRKRFGMKVVDGSLTKGQAMNLFARMQEGQGKIWRKQAEHRRAAALEIEERAKAGLLRRK
ncbi:hypothetical protein INT44_007459 [Umbelopsis vinacea]|uniref:P-loop containing nucleoside triphosphate hydrolase protein n=1 Tax=Umbelopsis vinacea TaxID=44442 RepID=A0A8H7UBH6_9FUNG|nr:hypothetical protein INT44_007459 [Umbelopsis vinacea]